MINALTLMSVLAAPPAAGLQPKVRPYDAQHYRLEVRQGDGGEFKNHLTATLKATKALTAIELDAWGLAVEQAKVDGAPAAFKLATVPGRKRGTLTLTLQKPIPAGKDAVVEVAYSVKAGTSHEGFFATTSPDARDGLPGYYTHFEPDFAQRFMPVNDTPADKATSEVLAVVDGRYQVVSNGRKEKDEAFTEEGRNLRRVHWRQEQPHSPYLIALAIAPLEPLVVSEDPPATIWVPPGTRDRAYIAQDVLKQLFNFQVGFVGVKYPFAKLDVVAVPRFAWSGMENTSVIFERASELLVDHRNDQTAASTIVGLLAHELAHQYFGDHVTCAWWTDLWLNEGFATYLGSLATDDYNNSDEVEVRRAAWLVDGYFREEAGPHAHPLVVRGVPAEEAFDSTSYTKGANVLRMLELWLGKAELKKVMKAWVEKYGGKVATSEDFFKVVFEVTKKEKELKPFRDAWLYKRGYPVISPEASYSGGKLTVTIRQQPSSTTEKGPFVFKLPIVAHRTNEPAYTQAQTILVDKPEVKVTFDVPAAPQWITWNKDFGALARVNPASVSEDQWVEAARNDPDPVWRLLATWTLLGELGHKTLVEETKPTETAMGAILDVLTKDPSPWVREAVLDRLANTRFKKLPPELAAPLFALARRPEGLTEDPAGYIRVRRAAMAALGRVDSPDGHRYLLEELGKRDIDINYLEGYAAGAARLGTPSALATLRAAMVTQKGRGPGYYLRAAGPAGLSGSVDVVPLLRDALKANPADSELTQALASALSDNEALRETQAFATLVRDVVLDEQTHPDEVRSPFLELLADVKYEAAKQALVEIAAKSTVGSFQEAAQRVLDANFPAPKAEPEKKKGKK